MDILKSIDQEEIIKAVQQRERKKAYDKEYKRKRRQAKRAELSSPGSDSHESQESQESHVSSTVASISDEPNGYDYVPHPVDCIEVDKHGLHALYAMNQKLKLTIDNLIEENHRLKMASQQWYLGVGESYLTKFRSGQN